MDFYFRDFQVAFEVYYVLRTLEIEVSFNVRNLCSGEYEIIITVLDGDDDVF